MSATLPKWITVAQDYVTSVGDPGSILKLVIGVDITHGNTGGEPRPRIGHVVEELVLRELISIQDLVTHRGHINYALMSKRHKRIDFLPVLRAVCAKPGTHQSV